MCIKCLIKYWALSKHFINIIIIMLHSRSNQYIKYFRMKNFKSLNYHVNKMLQLRLVIKIYCTYCGYVYF